MEFPFQGLLLILIGVGIDRLVSARMAKRAKFRWSARVDRVGLSADDPVFGSVQVQWGGGAVRNLYMAMLELENTSTRDFENVPLTIYPDVGTLLLNERTVIVNTPEIVKPSPEFAEKVRVEPGKEPTPEQSNLYYTRREYVVPVINRGQLLRFQYLCTRPQDDLIPTVYLNVSTKGVKLVQQAAQNLILKVPVDRARLLGILVTPLVVLATVAYLENIWFIAGLSLFVGWTVQFIGALIGTVWWWLRHRLLD